MQKLLTLNNLGVQGLNSDIRPWELPPEFITEGRNFRASNAALRASGGSLLWSTAPAFNPGFVMPVKTDASDFWLVAGRSAIYVFDGANWTNISSVTGYAGIGADGELLWNGCKLGKIPILNNELSTPEYWSPQQSSQVMQPLDFSVGNTWDSLNYTCKVIRSHRNFLFALNLNENGTDFSNSYRWSHPADINGLPFTWDETDQSALAGKAQIGGDSGRIIDGLSLRDSFCIYSENATNILDYRGDEFVWRRRELSSLFGLLSSNCVTEIKGTHFFIGDGDIVKNDGNKIDSIIHNRLRRNLTSRMSVDAYDKSYVVQSPVDKEIWFCVPEDNATLPNVAYIYNWRDDSWSVRDLPEGIAHAGYGTQVQPSLLWDDWNTRWDDAESTWGSRKDSPLDETVVGVNSATGELIMLDPKGQSVEINTVVERTDLPLEGHNNVTTLTRVYPHIDGNTPMTFQFGSQDHAGSAIRWLPEQSFTPGTDRKLDLRTTGELHCWRAKSQGSGRFILSGMDFEYSMSGKR